MIQKIGIIGAGTFGNLLGSILSNHAEVVIHDPHVSQSDVPKNVILSTLQTVAQSDLIIIAVNLESFESVCMQLKEHVQPESIVIDVCSVKVRPAKIMQEQLGDRCRLLATHPLFGPESYKQNNGTTGLDIVWHKLSEGSFGGVEALFAQKLGLNIIDMTPEEHDKEMAWVHGLTFFVGRGLVESQLPKLRLATGYFDHLMQLRNLELKHSKELFYTIEKGNPYAKEVRTMFTRTLEKLENDIQGYEKL